MTRETTPVLRVRALTIAAMLLMTPSIALAQDTADRAREQAENLEDQADVARQRAAEFDRMAAQAHARIDDLQARAGQVKDRLAAARAELERIEPLLAAATAALEDADAAATATAAAADLAADRAEAARARLDAGLERLAENEADRAGVVRDTYKYGPTASSPALAAFQMAEGSSATDVADVVHMLDVVLLDHSLLVDESFRLAEEAAILAEQAEQARQDRDDEAAAAERAREVAAERHAEVHQVLVAAESAVTIEREAVAELQAQGQAAADEAVSLAAARDQAEGEVADRLAAAARAAARAEELAAQEAANAVAVTPVSGGLVTVGGITVAASIAGQVEALLTDARAAGIVLGGYGYRSPETTARLRRANGCPDVHDSPASSCRVPTARPGTSMHEKGLAIDFTWQGRTICYPYPPSRCHGNAAFDWLRANAANYGLYGISSEAWHYSSNGR